MARTSRADSIYKVSVHRNGGHTYAATHPYTLDTNGRRRYSVQHWGTVTEDLRFIPGKRYLLASEEERSRLIFPDGWDLSAAEGGGGAGASGSCAPLPYTAADAGKAFGDVWLLERIVGRYGVRQDLCEALGDAARADDLLTLAYYPFLTGTSFLRFPRWQASTKVPSARPLEHLVGDSLAAVSQKALRRFMELRRGRHEGERICAVESVVRLSPGDVVADRKWGQKTERIHVQSAVDAVAYSLDTHIPVVFSSFPEAISDSRGMGVFRAQLAKAGLDGVIVVTDRGYDSLQGLEKYFPDGPMVMCVDVKQPAVLERIRAFGRFREHPAGMRYDAASRRWYRQYPLPAIVSSPDLDTHPQRSPLLNLFFNPGRRTAELAQIDSEIASQQTALRELADYRITVEDRRALRRDNYFFKIDYDTDTKTVTSFSPDKSRILSTRAASGFYANVTSGLDIFPLEAVSIYSLKYDQERFLRQYRSLLDFHMLPVHDGSLRPGIMILQYIGLLLNTRVSHSFYHPIPQSQDPSSSQSPNPFSSRPVHNITEALDELHDIPCIDAGDGTCALSSLTDLQQTILNILAP